MVGPCMPRDRRAPVLWGLRLFRLTGNPAAGGVFAAGQPRVQWRVAIGHGVSVMGRGALPFSFFSLCRYPNRERVHRKDVIAMQSMGCPPNRLWRGTGGRIQPTRSTLLISWGFFEGSPSASVADAWCASCVCVLCVAVCLCMCECVGCCVYAYACV